jgi:hypothetical protein
VCGLISIPPSPSKEVPFSPQRGPLLREEEFPLIRKGMVPHSHPGCSKDHAKEVPTLLHCLTSMNLKAFISQGMYKIAVREEKEWRMHQAEEIKSLLFRNSQLDSMREALHIQSGVVREVPDNDCGEDLL